MSVTVTEVGTFHETSAQATNRSVTLTGAVATGSLLVVAGCCDGWTLTSVTDTKSNTWTRTVNQSQGGGTTYYQAWSVITNALTTSDSITVTISGTGTICFVVEKCVGGGSFNASPVDQSSASGVSTGTSLTSNSTATTTQADDFLFGGDSINASTLTWTPAVVSPTWTTITSEDLVATIASGKRRTDSYYREVNATGAYAYAGTTSGTITSAAAGIIAYKAPAGGAAAVQQQLMTMGVGS